MGADRYTNPIEKTAEELAADAAAFLASRETPAPAPVGANVPVETKIYSDGTVVTGTWPLPDFSPGQQAHLERIFCQILDTLPGLNLDKVLEYLGKLGSENAKRIQVEIAADATQ